ncbi:hypothetical protein [Methylobacterium gregans]|uniref:Uncharacterized protein n=1 Tax=Methylobacterium gregans TaxID=374424 RepID=A0AA37M9W5_9HYPH|nr:hypothetical protein [Methylobacterium gregans]MDQ0523055.1 hypothetical protein [Methylobacterium gregans]GJD77298.1 hypothetical protein NBEOAGPD_0502 [Methylobacterium gregans]GLS56380.1 hypothetical protein GCM10007886_45650 [Methylobacterium gregans]
MSVVLRDMRDFKRFLSRPGAVIEIVRNTFVERQPAATQEAYRAKGMLAPRHLQSMSRKAAIFRLEGHPGTVWLYWDKGARGWRFEGDTVTVPLDTGLGPPDAVTYRCRYADGCEPETRTGRQQRRRIPADLFEAAPA